MLGYPGSHGNVSRFLTYLRRHEQDGGLAPKPHAAGLTPQQVVRLLLCPPTDRSAPQQTAVVRLRSLQPHISTSMDLLETFLPLVRQRGTGAECRLMG